MQSGTNHDGDRKLTSIRTTVHERRIDVPAPEELPDGTEVAVEVIPVGARIGLDESEWDDSPEAIEDWNRWLDSLEPLLFTEEELANLEADKKAQKEWEKRHFFEHADKLANSWG